MLFHSSNQLLLPVNPLFLWGSLLGAFLLSLVPLGRVAATPDVMALFLAFWSIHQPRRVGVGVGFGFGLLMDVHRGALLGQHALAYTLLNFLALLVHRRALWFSSWGQLVQVAPLFIAAHGVALVVRFLVGDGFPGWSLFLAPLFETLLWPLVGAMLLAPQRRAPDPDEDRPL